MDQWVPKQDFSFVMKVGTCPICKVRKRKNSFFLRWELREKFKYAITFMTL